MPVPTLITDLNVVESANSPAGTESIGANMDNYIRALSAFIAQNYEAIGTSSFDGTRQFNLYVSVSGNDATNDGLSVSTPFATLQKALDTMMTLGFVSGRRTINIAAGTYNTSGNRTARIGPANEAESGPANTDPYARDGVAPANYILIKGPDVGYDPTTNPWPTPTAIFDGGGTSVTGIQIEGRVNVLVKNIKFSNYSSGSAAGISTDGGWLRTENVHTENCVYGIVAQQARLEVRGGDIYGTPGKVGTGIRSIFLTYHSIGSQLAAGAGQGPRLRYLDVGFWAQEGSTGHSDSVSYEDCTTGILCTVNSRVNYSYSNFKRCSRAIRVEYKAVIYGYATANFNYLTANANTEAISVQSGGVDVDRDAYSNGVYATDYISSSVVVSATTSNIPILTKTLPIGRFAPTISSIRKPQHIEGRAFGRIDTTLAGLVEFKIRFLGSTQAAVQVSAGTTPRDFVIDFMVIFNASNQQELMIRMSPHLYSSQLCDIAHDSINFNANSWDLRLECQPTNTGDSITFTHAHMKVVG